MSATLVLKVRERRLAQMRRTVEAQIAAAKALSADAPAQRDVRLAALRTLQSQLDMKLARLRGRRAGAAG
jgi:hypothetical protein